jgi:ABC-type branched-subunit amino acid transport system ATPase component
VSATPATLRTAEPPPAFSAGRESATAERRREPSERVIELKDVSKSFGGVTANRDVTLSIGRGSITGLIGPNGSGKTTLFNSIAGYHPIDTGSIRFEGREISRMNVQKIARLGLVRNFQQTRVFRRMTCIDNMLIAAPHRASTWRDMFKPRMGGPIAKAEQLLEFVGLAAKRRLPAGSLSFGQQRLLELAMALMNDPKALLLDEPTAGINPTLINGLMDRLKAANHDFGITLFVIEHNMRVVMGLADYVYCMSRGEVLAAGPPEEIRRDRRVIDAYLGRQ